MNNTELLNALAAKLGTMTEYLWAALLKQAPISGICYLIIYLVIAAAGVGLYKIFKKCSADDNGQGDWVFPFAVGLFVWLPFVIIALCCIQVTVAAFINPDFWAMDYVLSALKKK